MAHKEWHGFDPEVDDTEWTDGWLRVPIALVPPGVHSSGYRVERHILTQADVFGVPMRLTVPFECRLLFDPEGRLWMSDTPQERIMMYNNGRRSRGRVLVGGLGLGLYLQYAAAGAAGQAIHFTIIERSAVVRDIVEPTLSVALGIPMDVGIGDIGETLSEPPADLYDTIFLDTWDTLDAAHLPAINRMRNRALDYLAPGGQVLLWGYRWMVRLFEDACRQLLKVPQGQREIWMAAQASISPQAVALLAPILDRFGEREINDMERALSWCRQHIMRRVEPV